MAISSTQGAYQEDLAPTPPQWLLRALGTVVGVAVLAFAFWPGSTLIERLRALDSGICAQLPTHSFYPGGQRLPLCARNTGIYLGFSIGVLSLFQRGLIRSARMPKGWVALGLLGFIALMGIDGLNSLFLDLHLPHLYQPDNFLRLTTGLLAGTAMAAFLVPVVNGILWRKPDLRAAYGSWRFMGLLAPFLVLAFLAVAAQWGWLLYPIAILSSVGIVTALSLINLTFVLAFTGRMERFTRAVQVAPAATLAVGLALLELLGLMLAKQSLMQGMSITQ
jgi:uncharacterized membrane protein